MKSLVDLKKEIKNGDIKNLYVFVGEENLIRKIYYEKIQPRTYSLVKNKTFS